MSRAAGSSLSVPAEASQIWRARLAVGVALGALVGAIVGAVIFAALGTVSTATSLVRLTPPAELTAMATGAQRVTPDTEAYVTQYVAGEVAYLSGNGFTRDVAESLGRAEPAQVDVLQEIGSSVVAFSGKADSDADAIRLVQAAIDVYDAQLEERSKRQLKTILPALDGWEVAARAADDVPRVRQVQELRESIGLQAGTPASVTVLQAPAVDPTSGNRWLLGAVLGALLGGALVPLRQIARRRKSGYVTSANDISDKVDGVIVPAVDLRQAGSGTGSNTSDTLARTLYAQCSSPGLARTIVLIGASTSSGTSVIASLFEKAAAEAGPVKAIRLEDEPAPPFRSADDDATLVIDAGAIGDSWLMEEAVRQATDLIVVVRLGADTVQQVFTVRSATTASEAPLAALMTFRSRHGFSLAEGTDGSTSDGLSTTTRSSH